MTLALPVGAVFLNAIPSFILHSTKLPMEIFFGEALALLYAGATYAIGWMWYGFPPQDPFEGQSDC